MTNITITSNNLNNPILEDAVFRDEILKFAGADTWVEGTILARQVVSTTVANGVADGGNTGDGTVTLCSVGSGVNVPKAGAYVLLCVAAATNGGIFQLTDPDGSVLAGSLVMTVGAGAATAFKVDGLAFTITDGATDFAVGDFFTITVTADGDLVPFAIAGAGGAQNPIAILTYEITTTGAEDRTERVAVSGRFRKEKLVIDADGDDSNVSAAVLDQLRSTGLVASNITELAIQDNS